MAGGAVLVVGVHCGLGRLGIESDLAGGVADRHADGDVTVPQPRRQRFGVREEGSVAEQERRVCAGHEGVCRAPLPAGLIEDGVVRVPVVVRHDGSYAVVGRLVDESPPHLVEQYDLRRDHRPGHPMGSILPSDRRAHRLAHDECVADGAWCCGRRRVVATQHAIPEIAADQLRVVGEATGCQHDRRRRRLLAPCLDTADATVGDQHCLDPVVEGELHIEATALGFESGDQGLAAPDRRMPAPFGLVPGELDRPELKADPAEPVHDGGRIVAKGPSQPGLDLPSIQGHVVLEHGIGRVVDSSRPLAAGAGRQQNGVGQAARTAGALLGLDDEHPGSVGRCGRRRGQTGRAAADDNHVEVRVGHPLVSGEVRDHRPIAGRTCRRSGSWPPGPGCPPRRPGSG